MIPAPTPGEFNRPLDYHSPGNGAPMRQTSPLLIALAWTVVGIPALWGVIQTAQKSVPLFKAPAAQTTSGSTATAGQSQNAAPAK